MPVTPSGAWPWHYTLEDLEVAGLPREHWMLDYFYYPGSLERYMQTGVFPNARRGHAPPPYGGPPGSGFPTAWNIPPTPNLHQYPPQTDQRRSQAHSSRPSPRRSRDRSRYTQWQQEPQYLQQHPRNQTSQQYTRRVEPVPGVPGRFRVPAEHIAELFPEGVVQQHAGGELTMRRRFRDAETGGPWTVSGPHPPLDPGDQSRIESPSPEQRRDRRRKEEEEEELRQDRFHGSSE